MKSAVLKLSFLLFFPMLTICLSAQTTQKARLPIDETSKLITYVKVQELKGASKDSLYKKAMNWCLTYFVNPNDVIREKDAKAGKIICKARFKVMNPVDKKGVATDGGNVQYTLNLQFKEGRFRYEFTEFNWKQTSYYPCEKWMDTSNQYYKPEFDYYLTQLDERANAIGDALIKTMLAKGPSKKEDW